MAKWTRNHPMAYGGTLLALGIVLTLISWVYAFADTTPSWLIGYNDIVERPEGNWNLVLFILGPILLIWGGFVVGEQLLLRRRFERLLDTPKRSEFTSRRRDLEDLTKKLPEHYGDRVDAKEAEFKSRRA